MSLKLYTLSEVNNIKESEILQVTEIAIMDEQIYETDFINFCKFTNLQELCLVKNNINNIPSEIKNLTNLKILRIFFNKILNITWGAI